MATVHVTTYHCGYILHRFPICCYGLSGLVAEAEREWLWWRNIFGDADNGNSGRTCAVFYTISNRSTNILDYKQTKNKNMSNGREGTQVEHIKHLDIRHKSYSQFHDANGPIPEEEFNYDLRKPYILTWNNHRWTFPSSEDRLAFRNYWHLQGEAYNFTKAN